VVAIWSAASQSGEALGQAGAEQDEVVGVEGFWLA
jgi:hypothetical protein